MSKKPQWEYSAGNPGYIAKDCWRQGGEYDSDLWVAYTPWHTPDKFYAGPDTANEDRDIGPFDTLEEAQACAVMHSTYEKEPS